MSRAAVVAAVLLVRAGAPASIDFGAVQLGGAALHRLAVPALGVSASGAGFSATRTAHGVLIVFEPYELHEQASGTLTLRTAGGVVRIALRGHGIDTIPPVVTVATPRVARTGQVLTIRFAATDNDLVRSCTLRVADRVIALLPWPAFAFRWRVPSGLGAHTRVTVVAVDRAGNRTSVSSRAFAVR
jgi:hypothetical protein